MNDRLYRSSTDRVFTGLCGGLAEHFDLDPSLVRLAWVLLGILTGVFPLLVVYVVMALVVPEEPPAGAPGSWPGWSGPLWGPGAPAAPGSGEAPGTPTAPGTGPAGEGGTPPPTGGEGSAGSGPGGEQPAGAWGPWGPPPPVGSDWRTVRAYARAQRRAQRAYWRQQRWGGDVSTAGLIFGVILVVVGGLFLLQQTVPGFNADLFWPVALIVLGALLLAGAFRR